MGYLKNDRLLLGERYIHTGNSGGKISIYRDERRTDRAKLQFSISAMGLIESKINIMGPDYDGFHSDQLRDIANMFLFAAQMLEKDSKDQNFVGKNDNVQIISCKKEDGFGFENSNLDDAYNSGEETDEDDSSNFKKVRRTIQKATLQYKNIANDIVETLFEERFGIIKSFEKMVEKEPSLTKKKLLYRSLKKQIDKLKE